MKINKDSWHYKLWVKSFIGRVPAETDLCRYCHRVFWQLAGRALYAFSILLLIGIILLALVGAVRGFYAHPLLGFEVTTGIIAAVTAIALYIRWINRGQRSAEPATLVGKYAKASKDKVCPLVQFSDSE